jgi:alpha-D-ribose 1-methylphosphonate 5-triphosphate synthase subunit PhnG
MFHTFDNPATAPGLNRPGWMALLARAPVDLLEAGLGEHALAQPHWLRAPETGLMMVQGRAGGTGERFNLGELSVTRCALRMRHGEADSAVGVAYVLGRVHRQARLAAVADALLQDPAQQAGLDQRLLAPIRQHLAAQRTERAAGVQATKVAFFTVAREAGAPGEEEDGE